MYMIKTYNIFSIIFKIIIYKSYLLHIIYFDFIVNFFFHMSYDLKIAIF